MYKSRAESLVDVERTLTTQLAPRASTMHVASQCASILYIMCPLPIVWAKLMPTIECTVLQPSCLANCTSLPSAQCLSQEQSQIARRC